MSDDRKAGPKLRVQNISESIQHVIPGRLVPPNGTAELNEAETEVFLTGTKDPEETPENPTNKPSVLKRRALMGKTWRIVLSTPEDAELARGKVKRDTPPVLAPVEPPAAETTP